MSSFVLCVGCGEPLYGFLPCRWCTCERYGIDLVNGFCPLCNSRNLCAYDPNQNSFDCPPDSYHPLHPTHETYLGDSCGIDSHLGYDCPPQFPLKYEPEPGYIQNYNSYPHDSPSFPQQYPCYDNCGGLHETFQCQPMNQNSYNSNFSGFDQSQTPQFPVIHLPPQETSIELLHNHENVLLLAWDRVVEIKDALGTKKYKPEDLQELFRKLSNDVQNINEELAEYINTPGWNRPAFYDDDDDDDVDCTIAITPILSTEDPIDFLSMGDEQLDTISATESDEVIKSSVEDLVQIPSEFEGIPDTMCDVHLVNNPTPLEAKDHFEIVTKQNTCSKPPKNYARCAKCRHPVNGPYCQGCAFLREKLEEDLVTYFQNFQNTFESSDDSTNVVNAPREPFVVKKDHGVNPSHIDECCCECGAMLNMVTTVHLKLRLSIRSWVTVRTLIFRKIFTIFNNSISVVISVGARTRLFNVKKGLHETFQCQPINQNFYNPNSSGFDQTQPPQFPVIHPPPQETSIEIFHDQENVINSVQTFFRKFNRYSFFETLKVLLLAWDRVFKIKDALGTKQYKPKDIQELFRQLLNDVQKIHEELADESKGIPDTMCDVHLVNNPTPLEAKDHFEIVINSNDDISSSDDDSLYKENIKYVEASPHDSELVNLEATEIIIPEIKEINSGSTTTHSDISLLDYECPPTDRSDLTHKEINSLTSYLHRSMIISTLGICPIRYSRKLEDSCQRILSSKSSFPQLQLGINIPGNLKTLAKGFYPPSLNFLSFNWESSKRKSRKGQNRIETGQKREAWRSREKSKIVTVNKGLE
nr:hypothetical protein [Tanacetum cinerariifolium]